MSIQSASLYKTLQKLYSRKINLGLNRVNKVLNVLGKPHLQLNNPINILGSDGKMSVLTSLKYFIEADKKKVTAFTSPHLYDFRHRFWLKNRYISIVEIKKFIKIIKKTKLNLTLFELLTCVYILAAKNINNISYNLVESGLLFKRDSTNLWNSPRAQIITNINFQHQDWINPKTIKEICIQKVAYLSKNSNIYIARQNPKTLKIIKNILKKNPSKKIYSSNWKIIKKNNKKYYKDNNQTILLNTKLIHSDALIDNLCLAIKVALDLGIKKKVISKTLPQIKFEGRVQYINKGKLKNLLNKNEKILIDGCHSEASAKNLYNYLKTVKGPIYGIWGMQKNKLPEKFIKSFKKIFKKIITIPIQDEPNALMPKELRVISEKFGIRTEACTSIEKALKKLSSAEKKTIVIFGSLYLIGSVLSKN